MNKDFISSKEHLIDVILAQKATLRRLRQQQRDREMEIGEIVSTLQVVIDFLKLIGRPSSR